MRDSRAISRRSEVDPDLVITHVGLDDYEVARRWTSGRDRVLRDRDYNDEGRMSFRKVTESSTLRSRERVVRGIQRQVEKCTATT